MIRPSRLLSVRTSTVVVATAAMAVGLLVGALVLQSQLHNSLFSSIENQAKTSALSTAELIETGRYPAPLESSSSLPVWIQVVNTDGNPVTATSNAISLKKAFATLPPDERLTVRRLQGLTIDTGKPLAVASVMTKVGSRNLWVLAAVPLDVADAADETTERVLLLTFPALLVLASALMAVMVRRALRPVEAIRARVATISTQDLTNRVPVPPGNDEISALASTMNEMLNRLQSAVEQQRRFVGDASHELRSPLASLRSQLEVSTLDNTDPEWQRSVEGMLVDHDRIDRLVQDLLLLARFDTNKPVALEPTDLGYIVRRELRQRNTPEGISVTVDAPNTLVLGNDDSLTRILRNLIDNAERHATTNVHVLVRSTPAELVELTVSNDGPTIPSTEHQRIFQRFTRLDNARNSDTGGSGLGLAIVSDLVASQHGTIACVPDPSGATFVARFPALQLSLHT
jgi:signal transduction histidine kinase